MKERLTKFNPETGLYEFHEPAKTQAEFTAQRKAVIQRLGEIEDKQEVITDTENKSNNSADKSNKKVCKDCIHYPICDPYVAPNESFPEVEGGCGAFKAKADFVEVVRCKDCTEWDEKEQECSHWYGFKENDYCSYGERREK